MNLRLLAILLSLITSLGAYSQMGEITFIDGEVELVRNEETLTEQDLTIGDEIENYDQINTGPDGQVIVNVTSRRTPDAEIHIASNTTFIFDINKVKNDDITTLSLITGSLSLNVQKLGSNQKFRVQTEAVTMGVRGTEFAVETSPSADVLITCSNGNVACRDEDSKRVIDAQPGQVVEKRSSEEIAAVPVALTDLQGYRKRWLDERISAFKPNALRVIKFYARQYDDLYNRFNAEYDALMAERDVLEKWIREDRENRLGGRIQMMQEKKQIIGNLFRVRRILFVFEKVYYRLLELHRYFQEGYGQGEIAPGLTTAEFFRGFLSQREDLAAKVRKVRYIMKLYAKRNDGNFPTSLF
jgi:hypothetical protein